MQRPSTADPNPTKLQKTFELVAAPQEQETLVEPNGLTKRVAWNPKANEATLKQYEYMFEVVEAVKPVPEQTTQVSFSPQVDTKLISNNSSQPDSQTFPSSSLPDLPEGLHRREGAQLLFANITSWSIKVREFIRQNKHYMYALVETHCVNTSRIKKFFKRLHFRLFITPAVANADGTGNSGGECIAIHQNYHSYEVKKSLLAEVLKKLGIPPHFAVAIVKFQGREFLLGAIYLDGEEGISQANYYRLQAVVTIAKLLNLGLILNGDLNIHIIDLVKSGWLKSLGLDVFGPQAANPPRTSSQGDLLISCFCQ